MKWWAWHRTTSKRYGNEGQEDHMSVFMHRADPAVYHVDKELAVLIEHHSEILERKFPGYEYRHTLREGPDCWIRVDAVDTSDNQLLIRTIFTVNFSLSSFQVRVRRTPQQQELKVVLNMDYADPKFTDDLLSDILAGLETYAHH